MVIALRTGFRAKIDRPQFRQQLRSSWQKKLQFSCLRVFRRALDRSTINEGASRLEMRAVCSCSSARSKTRRNPPTAPVNSVRIDRRDPG